MSVPSKINNVTLNINNNTNININNPFNPNHANMINQQMKTFPTPFHNPALMGLNQKINPNNMMNFSIFNPMMQQNKPKPHNIFAFNQMNTPQRFKMPDNNKPFDQNIQFYSNKNEERSTNILDNIEAPDTLKDYLSRAYQKCNNIAEKIQMDKFLRKIINLSKIHNDMHVRDWKNHPLPTLPRERMELNKDNTNGFNLNNLEINENFQQNEAASSKKYRRNENNLNFRSR